MNMVWRMRRERMTDGLNTYFLFVLFFMFVLLFEPIVLELKWEEGPE